MQTAIRGYTLAEPEWTSPVQNVAVKESVGLRISFLLAALGLFLYLTVSDPLLAMLGIPYTAPSGSFIYKLHPATYLCLLALPIAFFFSSRSWRTRHRLRQNVSYCLYGLVIVMLMVYTTYRYGTSGSAFLIDTLLMPAVIGLTLNFYPDKWRAFLFKMILVICCVNALLGIVEAMTQWRLEEYSVAGGTLIIENEFRATALMGHPLTNAMVMSLATFGMLVWCRHWMSRILVAFLALITLLAFGGRTAFLLTSLLLSLCAAYAIIQSARKGRIRAWHLLVCLITFGLLCAILGGAILYLDLGARIFEGLVWDESADIRRRSMMAFDFLSIEQLLLGVSPGEIAEIILRINIRNPIEIIENTWIVLTLQFGVISLVMLIASYGFLLLQLARKAPPLMKVGLLSFLILTSSNNALSVKTMVLVFTVSVVMTSESFVQLHDRRRIRYRSRR
ncbi:VpsF family polysaccharide biosynthesis protein [Dongia soli]|uniref:VpsF family polysaccharide biosynthesis protein n=1 Tax=Dongia soli TaxID=600628 RepID=A0ABU5EF72_9PROT|nr:VpsF family polysaccharide biosynthesis protein [Dongia soli]MDY0884256.1 VpsF family polysaccharide biosynthesis protein [Dongia soli]